jgi:hypothetical protein
MAALIGLRERKICIISDLVVRLQGSTDTASIYPAQLSQLIEEGGCCFHQVFNVIETWLFWKKMLIRTLIVKEKTVEGYQPTKEAYPASRRQCSRLLDTQTPPFIL